MSEARFAEAIRNYDIQTLKILLEKEPGLVNSRDSDLKLSWLDLCFQEKHIKGRLCECVKVLVNHGARINRVHYETQLWRPITEAIHVECSSCLNLLIEKGANLHFKDFQGKTALIFAIELESHASVETLCRHCTPAIINHRDERGKTALMCAAGCRGQDAPSLCQQLIEAGADVNIADKNGETALILAVIEGTYANVASLMQHSNQKLINHKDNYGKTALMYAIEHYGHDAPSVCQQLIKLGADINIADSSGNTALMWAVSRNEGRCAEVLIRYATPKLINHRNKWEKTALIWATNRCRQNAVSLCQQLIKAGADVNITDERGMSVLMYAAKKNKTEYDKLFNQRVKPKILHQRDDDGQMWTDESKRQAATSLYQCLIEAGADVNIAAEDGKTVLIHAAKKNTDKWDEVLIKYSTPKLLNHRDNGGMTALMWAARCDGQDAPTRCRQLIEAGADVNVADEKGKTALIHTVFYNEGRCAEVLIQHASSMLINQKDNDGRTALMWSLNIQDLNAVTLCTKLLKAGAGLNITDNDGATALTHAIKINAAKCFDFLIQHADHSVINRRDNTGKTALMWAAYNRQARAHEIRKSIWYAQASKHSQIASQIQDISTTSFCKQLLAAGANVNVKDNDDQTALQIAVKMKRKDIVSLLLENGAFANTISVNGKTPFYKATNSNYSSLLEQLINKGADPTFSRKHACLIHKTLEKNDVAKLRTLVMNGFPPHECTLSDYGPYIRNHCQKGHNSASPLTFALLKNKPDIALYLIINKFFTLFDINKTLSQKTELRQRLAEFETNECLQILEFHSKKVQTLSTLCLVTISSALTQDFLEDNVATSTPYTKWRFTPTFKERVESLGLPPKLQRDLLHQTPSSRICCWQWKNILPEEERQFADCNECDFCTGVVDLYESEYKDISEFMY